MGKNKGNRGKKESKNTPDATWHGKSEAEPNGKIGSKKTPDSTHHGQSEKVANCKIGSKTPEPTRRSRIEAEFNANIGSQKTQEAASQIRSEAEANPEEESNLGRTKVIPLQGVWDPEKLADQGLILFHTDPYKIHYDIYRFLCHWGYVFMWVCAIAFVVILSAGDKLLSTNYNESLWIIVLSICFMYFIASISAMLALKELPDLLAYILKYAGIFSSIIVGIFTAVTLTRGSVLYIDFDEAFEKTVHSLCIIWWIAIISLMVTVVAIRHPRKLKVELRCFINFITLWGLLFCLLLIMLIFLAINCGQNLLGYEFDEIFFKISVSICLVHILASASVAYVRRTQKSDKKLFQLAA